MAGARDPCGLPPKRLARTIFLVHGRNDHKDAYNFASNHALPSFKRTIKREVKLEERVFEQFASVLDLSELSDRNLLVYNDFPGWDSVAHMTLIAALEQEFDCMLEMDDILDMSSFNAAVEIMKKYA